MKKKIISLALCLLIVWLNVFATERIEWQGVGDEINVSYSGEYGTVQIWANSLNYQYSFTLSAENFQGVFQGNGTGFSNNWNFENGGHVSVIDVNGTIIQTASGAEAGKLLETLTTSGVASDLSVHIVIEGEKVSLDAEQDPPLLLPPPKPSPIILSHYIYDENRNKIGGYFKNVGNAEFKGRIAFVAGLSYAHGWTAESVTYYTNGSSDQIINLRINEELPFYIVQNPQGGLTFVFPTLINDNSPMAFSIFPPVADSQAVENFREMIYSWWTGYKDPEPTVDYMNIKIELKGVNKSRKVEVKNLLFLGAISPYFSPPR